MSLIQEIPSSSSSLSSSSPNVPQSSLPVSSFLIQQLPIFLTRNTSSLPAELFLNNNRTEPSDNHMNEMNLSLNDEKSSNDSSKEENFFNQLNYDLNEEENINESNKSLIKFLLNLVNSNDSYPDTTFEQSISSSSSSNIASNMSSLLHVPHIPSLHPHLSQIAQSYLGQEHDTNKSDHTSNLNSFNMVHEDGNILMNLNWFILLLGLLVVVGVLGNTLVCLAICYERRLQNATNYFLLSLAIADLLVSIIVMPISILYEFYGFWPFGYTTCNFWVTFDVLCCSSSIYHMVFISVGRYIGIKNPLHARQTLMVSRRAVVYKIALAWLLSALISSPITILALIDKNNIQVDSTSCYISNNYFLFFGSFAAFYLPMFVMINCFILTVRLLNQKAKFCRTSGSSSGTEQSRIRETNTVQSGVVTHGDESVTIGQDDRSSSECCPSSTNVNQGNNTTNKNGKSSSSFLSSPKCSKKENVSSKSGTCSKSSTSNKKRSSKGGIVLSSMEKQDTIEQAATTTHGHHRQFNTEPLMTRTFGSSLQVRTEQKASKVLGLVFFVFAVCWTPFFTLNLAQAIIPNLHVPTYLSTTFLWLGYSSSTMNPIIYTVFNRNFRRAFMKVLKCAYTCNGNDGTNVGMLHTTRGLSTQV